MPFPAGSVLLSIVPHLQQGWQNEINRQTSEGGSQAGEGFGDKFKLGLAAAGIAAGALLAKGVFDSLDVEASRDKLAAQLGLTAEQSETAGRIAGGLYSSAYGDSLADVNEAIRQVSLNIGGLGDISEDELKSITATALDLTSVFDQDLNMATAAVGQMMKTGLADNAQEAFDILTVGLQNGANKADDLLETFNEYGTQFRQIGLDGETAMGLLTQGLQAGARDADIVADALKEFAIRAQDGSTTTAEGFKAIGLNATQMAAAVAKGGPESAQALDMTLDKLRAIKDPAMQAQAAVALFGTQSEDMQEALYALDPSTAVAGLGQVEGAAAQVGVTFADNAKTNLDIFKRSLTTTLTNAIGGVALPALMGLALFLVNNLGPALKTVGDVVLAVARFFGDHFQPIIVVVTALLVAMLPHFIALGVQATISAAKTFAAWVLMQAGAFAAMVSHSAAVVGIVAGWVLVGVQSLLNAAKVAAAWLIAMGPIGLIIAAVIAVVALIIANWDTIARVTAELWQKVKDWTASAWEWVKSAIGQALEFVKNLFLNFTGPGLIIKHWDTIKEATGKAWDWITDKISGFIGFFNGIGQKIGNAALGMWDGIKDSFRAVLNWIIDKWNNLSFGIKGGSFLGIDYPDMRLETPDIPRFAKGGVAKGLAIVGEQGPELVTVASASRVFPHDELMNSLSNAQARTVVEKHYHYHNESKLKDPLAEEFREMERLELPLV